MRKLLIAANWKMYKTPSEAQTFLHAFLPLVKEQSGSDIVICPPSVDLATALHSVKGSQVRVGAQTMHFADEGAYTGEVSPAMLVALGVSHVILGHSERRQYFAETDETVNKKLKAALKHNLVPIVCVGEHEEHREKGMTEEILCQQISRALDSIESSMLGPLVIAYEPIWAIGTGRTATPTMAAEAHLVVRSEVARVVGRGVADAVRILYGGSVKPENAAALLGSRRSTAHWWEALVWIRIRWRRLLRRVRWVEITGRVRWSELRASRERLPIPLKPKSGLEWATLPFLHDDN